MRNLIRRIAQALWPPEITIMEARTLTFYDYDNPHAVPVPYRVFVFQRGTKIMRVGAVNLSEAMETAERHKFRGPYDAVCAMSQSDDCDFARDER